MNGRTPTLRDRPRPASLLLSHPGSAALREGQETQERQRMRSRSCSRHRPLTHRPQAPRPVRIPAARAIPTAPPPRARAARAAHSRPSLRAPPSCSRPAPLRRRRRRRIAPEARREMECAVFPSAAPRAENLPRSESRSQCVRVNAVKAGARAEVEVRVGVPVRAGALGGNGTEQGCGPAGVRSAATRSSRTRS